MDQIRFQRKTIKQQTITKKKKKTKKKKPIFGWLEVKHVSNIALLEERNILERENSREEPIRRLEDLT